VSIKKQALLTLREQLSSSRFFWSSMLFISLAFSLVLYFVSVLCLVCRILSVPLDCHFFNVPSFMFSVCAFLFALFYVLSFFFVACLVCPILPVSLECPFFGFP
jgi:hypothetical protein